jgi:HlyD family secretion protein
MRKLVVVGVVGAILVAFTGTLAFLWTQSGTEPASFDLERPERRDIVRKTVATGAIEPRLEVQIKPQVSGILEELFVEPGQPIDKDATIARIRVIPDVVRLNDAEASLSAARINYENAKKELARYEKLRGVVSDAEYNRQRLDFELSEQRLDTARSHLQLVRDGAARSGARSNIVRSTVAGMVLDVPVKEGTSVIEANTFNAGTTVATVADMTDMIFTGWVDEADVGKLRQGMSLDIKVGALEKVTFLGTLETIAPKSTRNNGAIQFEVRAAVQQREGRFLRAGYSANANIVLDRRTDVLALNERALQFDDSEPFVEVQDGPERFSRRELETGISDGIYIEVVSGLEEGDRVKVPEVSSREDS